ncbi:MAG: hypothetical protein ABFD10_20220 [Prolixibacteraceae bacterium]
MIFYNHFIHVNYKIAYLHPNRIVVIFIILLITHLAFRREAKNLSELGLTFLAASLHRRLGTDFGRLIYYSALLTTLITALFFLLFIFVVRLMPQKHEWQD